MGVPKTQDLYAFRMTLFLSFSRGRDWKNNYQPYITWSPGEVKSEVLSAHTASPWTTIVDGRISEEIGNLEISDLFVPERSAGVYQCTAVVTTKHVHTLEQIHAFKRYAESIAERISRHLPKMSHMRMQIEIIGTRSDLYWPIDDQIAWRAQ